MFNFKKETILHNLFITGIIIKAIDGILEIIGGAILFLVNSTTISKIIQIIFQQEIAQDSADIITNYLIHLSQTLPITTIHFIALYLVIHGIIKIGMFAGLWYKKMWAYPISGAILFLFVMYQLKTFSNTHSILLLFLTVVDTLILISLNFEYKKLKHSSHK